MDNIRFIKHYDQYREDFYEVHYKSGAIRTYIAPNLPTTTYKFFEEAECIPYNDTISHMMTAIYYRDATDRFVQHALSKLVTIKEENK